MNQTQRCLLLILVITACSSSSKSPPTGGEFVTSHFAIDGMVVSSLDGTPVTGASVTVKIHETDCSSQVFTLFQLQSENGAFQDVLEFLELPSEIACLTIDVTPPQGSGLMAKTVTVPGVTVVRSTTPPDTVEVLVSLDSN